MPVPKHLRIDFDPSHVGGLLEDWRWLVPNNFAPIVITGFGDMFLRDDAGRIYFLDVMAGNLEPAASSDAEFDRLCDDRQQRQRWFSAFLLGELRAKRGELGPRECFSCKIPLTLGGELVAENFDPVDLEVHVSILGQIHHQTKNLTLGTKIGSIEVRHSADTNEGLH